MDSILITGGCGFIGSNFIEYCIDKYDYHIINIDALTYAANPDNVKEVANHKRYTFIHGNICDRELLQSIFHKYTIKGVIHFAAESHVDNSIKDAENFITTNIVGT
ncbi:MAG: GDP-mannose 4,6-dehydratase, partial [Spirochaetes bacterium]|nr:GDP-mannose 4,6-dehydratase [Spirochaetota bacterium]